MMHTVPVSNPGIPCVNIRNGKIDWVDSHNKVENHESNRSQGRQQNLCFLIQECATYWALVSEIGKLTASVAPDEPNDTNQIKAKDTNNN